LLEFYLRELNPLPSQARYMMTSERVFTRGARRINYRVLNDGSDEEALPEDRIVDLDATPEPQAPQVPTTSDDSQMLTTTDVAEPDSTQIITTATLASRRRERPAPATEWVWPYFKVTTVEREWIVKRTGKRRIVDRDICCAYVDEKTGTKCDWKTTDSVRQTATSNMKNHLTKHGILSPSTNVGLSQPSQQKPSIIALLTKKENITTQQRLEKNILRWVVTSKQPFTVVQDPDFKQIFLDISGVSPPFSTRYTLRLAIEDEFKKQRLQLKDDLSTTCSTIALSLDVWTSSNSLPILAIIGHWLATEFEYRQQVIEFTILAIIGLWLMNIGNR
jgi:hypothetical protein